MLVVETESFHGVIRKEFPNFREPTYGSMRCSSEIYWNRNGRLPVGCQWIISVHPTVEIVQTCFYQAPK